MTTSTLPLFYKKVVPLNKEQHSKLYIEPIDGFNFARDSNSLYVAAVEFPQASREYPVVFGADADGNVYPVVLLGLRDNENLYVNDKGVWEASYIPAYVRRYPFILATPDGDKFTVCIDEGHSGFNTAQEGSPLFDKKGEYTEILTQAVDFLKDYQTHVQLTTQFCKNLQELDILEPMQANIEMKTGESFSIGGFQCVNREKLKALTAKKLAELVKSDQMELIMMHLQSLANVNTLTARLK